MLIGYARVSTDDQDLRLQRAALKEAGCKRVYEEKISGARRNRPQLARLLDQVREDDVVVVARLDRLARSTRDLLDVAEQLKEAGAGLRSLGEPWADTTSPAGRMVLTVFAGIAEFERALIQQRTSSGRVAAMQRGVRFGRPAKLEADQIALARRLVEEGTPVRGVAAMLKVHPATLYRALTVDPSDAALENPQDATPPAHAMAVEDVPSSAMPSARSTPQAPSAAARSSTRRRSPKTTNAPPPGSR